MCLRCNRTLRGNLMMECRHDGISCAHELHFLAQRYLAVATLGCAVAATGTLVVARKAEGWSALRAGGANSALQEGDVRERIGREE